MRLIFALPQVPWPAIGGGRTRFWSLSSHLARHHETHVFALQSPDEPTAEAPTDLPFASVTIVPIPTTSPPRWSAAWLALRARTLRHPAAVFYRAEAERVFAELVARLRPDVIVYGMSWMLPYARVAGRVPSVVDEHNFDPLITARIGAGRTGFDRLKWRLYLAATTRSERRNLRRVQGIAACSEDDAMLFGRVAPHADIAVVPNGVDTSSVTPSALGEDVIMTGSFSYSPNAEGARRLVNRIWPLVRSRLPHATLRLVGLHGERVLTDLIGAPGVTVVGTVADMRPELARARVAVAPIDVGGGTRIKIIEAFAAGRPVVSTTIGAEGLAVRDADTAFLRDDDAGFAEAIVRLLQDRSLATAMGSRALVLAVDRYDWRVSARHLESLIRRVAA